MRYLETNKKYAAFVGTASTKKKPLSRETGNIQAEFYEELEYTMSTPDLLGEDKDTWLALSQVKMQEAFARAHLQGVCSHFPIFQRL